MTFTERAGTIRLAAPSAVRTRERPAAGHRADRTHVAWARGLSRWRRQEHASASASGRSGVRRACRFTTSKRARASSSRRRCSARTSGASGRSRFRGCCGWPRSTRCRPISCCRASSRARSASSTSAGGVDRPGERRSRSTSCACTTLDDPDAQISRPVRDVDPARAPGLQRPHAHDPALRPARARGVHGPQPRRARRPARAARPARLRLSPPFPASGSPVGFGGSSRYPDRTLAAPRTTSPPPTTSVKILVPGNHLMVGLLGQRDELLRIVEAAFPVQILVRGNEITITGDARRRRARRPPLRGAGRAARTGSRARPRRPRPVDRDAEGRPAPDRGAHHRGRARPQERSGRRPPGQKRYVDAVRDHTVTFAIGPGRHRQELPRGRARGAGAAGQGSEPHHPHPARGRGGRAARLPARRHARRRSIRTCARSTTRSTTCSSPRSWRG